MDDVRGDFLGAPHGTTPAAVIANKLQLRSFKSSEPIKMCTLIKMVQHSTVRVLWQVKQTRNIPNTDHLKYIMVVF